MKHLNIILLFITCIQVSYGQSVDFKLINYKGLNFYSTKSEIMKKLGKPMNTFKPNYECGFLSSHEQSADYFSLNYGKVTFTGNEKEEYLIEKIDFENDQSIVLKYGDYNLTCETELTELSQIFGNKIMEHFGNNPNGGIVIYHEKYDDGIRLEIKGGKLVRFEYWSPC